MSIFHFYQSMTALKYGKYKLSVLFSIPPDATIHSSKLWFIAVFAVKALLWSICISHPCSSLSRKLAAEWETADQVCVWGKKVKYPRRDWEEVVNAKETWGDRSKAEQGKWTEEIVWLWGRSWCHVYYLMKKTCDMRLKAAMTGTWITHTQSGPTFRNLIILYCTKSD